MCCQLDTAKRRVGRRDAKLSDLGFRRCIAWLLSYGTNALADREKGNQPKNFPVIE